MRKKTHILIAAAVLILALFGHTEKMQYLAMLCALAEICALFAPEMYYVSAAMELDDARRGGLWHAALLMGAVGAVIAVLLSVFVGLGGPVPALWLMVLLLAVRLDTRPGRGAKPFFCMALLRSLPEAFLLRGVYIVPAGALLIVAWYGWGVSTVPAYAAGLLVFPALRVQNRPVGAEIERFPVRWVFGALATAVCAALGFNGVFSAVYCAWAVIAALLPVRHGGKAWLCALLVTLQAVCGWAGVTYGVTAITAAAAFICALGVILLQHRAIYAAWLPLRAKMIRRRAK